MRARHQRQTRGMTGLAILVLIVGGVGCSQAPPPVIETAPPVSVKTPVVFVPGVTGVALRDGVTGRYVWGRGKNLIRPHDRGHGMARSLTASHPGPQLVPGGVILDLKLFGLIRFRVYQQLVDLFRAHGYRLGDLEHPRPTDEFFLYSYDWRQDNVASAARLADQLEALRRARGQKTLRINLICQSNGAHVCRYFTKYGGLDLEEAESGLARAPASSTVENLILVGASNGGSIRVLRELDRGRRYVDLVGRRFAPETLFTFISLYQDLPAYSDDLFVDESGRPMAVDLYDAETWKRFQWSIYGWQMSRRSGRDDLPSWFGSQAQRHGYLVGALDRARRFHGLLQQDAKDFGATRYYLIANTGIETSSRAVLVRETEGWQTRFADDKKVRRNSTLRSAVVVAGDGHATAASQKWLSPQEIERLGRNVREVEGTHRRIILQDSAHQWIMQILAAGAPDGS